MGWLSRTEAPQDGSCAHGSHVASSGRRRERGKEGVREVLGWKGWSEKIGLSYCKDCALNLYALVLRMK